MSIEKTGFFSRYFPIVNWFPPKGDTVGADIIAGITVSLILIPQSMAYAQIAGLPPVYGLYAAFLPSIISAVFGWSSHLACGPSAMTSLLTYEVISNTIPGASTAQLIQLAIMLSLVVGFIRLLCGLFKLGSIVNFISEPVIKGFICAGSLIIASSQFGSIFGLEKSIFLDENNEGINFFEKLYAIITHIGDIRPLTAIVGFSSLALLIICKKISKRIPGSLIVVIIASAVTWVANLDQPEHGALAVVGTIKAGFPPMSSPFESEYFNFATIYKLLPGCLMITFIGFMEITGVVKALAAKTREDINLNQDLIGQGLSSIFGSFTSCYPVGGSFSRSALSYSAGARTAFTHIISAVCVMATLLWLTPLLYYLPKATLSAIIIMAVISLFDAKSLLHAWQASRLDGFAAFVTFIATLWMAPEMTNGIIIGAVLALVLHLYSTMNPRVCYVETHPDGTLRDAGKHSLKVNEQLPTVRFDGNLYFVNASYFEVKILETVRNFPQARHIIVSGDSINSLDASGELMLEKLCHIMKEVGVQLLFVGLKMQVVDVLKRTGLYDKLGSNHFFRTRQEVEDYIARKKESRKFLQ